MDKLFFKYINYIEVMSPYDQNREEMNLETADPSVCGSIESNDYSIADGIVKQDDLINIKLHQGDDYQKILYDIFSKLTGPKRIIIDDLDNILPEYADNWNGVEVIRNKESFADKDLDIVSSDIAEIVETQSAEQTVPSAIIDNEDEIPLKLNLGCGNDLLEDFQNIDLFVSGDGIIKMDALELDYNDNEVDEILAKNLLQYMPMNELKLALQEWGRVLKPGGLLRLECSSLKLMAKAMINESWDFDLADKMFYGKQSHPGDYILNAFDSNKIKTHLEYAGMQVVKINEDVMENMGLKRYSITATAKIPELRREPETENHAEVSGQMGFENMNDNDIDEQSKNVNSPKYDNMNKLTGFDFSDEVLKTASDNNEDDVISHNETSKELNIVWEGSQFVYHSLALINREHCSNIIDSGLAELHIVPYEKDTFFPEGNEKYEKLHKQDIRYKSDSPNAVKQLPYLWIRHQWPTDPEPPKGAKWVIMQPWEFSQIRKDFADTFAKADEIWTPSNYSRKCIVSSGVDFSKVQVVPNGINPKLAIPKGDKYPLKTKKRFKLLFVGGTIYRKGFDILLKTYLSAFTSELDICLVIKDMGGDSFYKGMTAKDQIDEVRTNPKYPEIEFIDDTLSEEEMFDLYRACDIFVSPYRGEGFSLPTLEAMACGLPVVVTAGGATDDFCDEEVAWLIPSSKVSIGNDLDGAPLTGEAFLLEPDSNVLTDTLKYIFLNPGEVIKTGINAQYRARTKWTWKLATKKIFSRIDALYGKQLAKKAEKFLIDEKDVFMIIGEAEEEYNNNNNAIATELFEEAIKSNLLTERYRIHCIHRLAIMNIEFGDYEKAESYLEQVSIIYPDHPDTMYIKSILREEEDDFIGALEVRSPLLDNWVKDKFISSIGINLDTILNDTADNFYHQGDLENALKLYSEALKINNYNPFSCLGAARCFANANIIDEAINMYEWALKLDPDLEEAREELEEISK